MMSGGAPVWVFRLCGMTVKSRRPGGSFVMSSMDEVIMAINFIEANLTKKMDLAMISGAVHYSKYQRRQLTESAKLLVFSCKPIVQIAFLSGYQSQQAFTNAFTAMYRMPPNMYRENERFSPSE